MYVKKKFSHVCHHQTALIELIRIHSRQKTHDTFVQNRNYIHRGTSASVSVNKHMGFLQDIEAQHYT